MNRLEVKFSDGNTNETQYIGLFRHNRFLGSVSTIDSFLKSSDNATHVAILEEYGNDSTVTVVYPVSQVVSFKEL